MMQSRLRVAMAASMSLAIAGWSVTPLAESVGTLPGSQLGEYCRAYAQAPDGPDGRLCLAYIQGFLDGAVVTDERVARTVTAEHEKTETFSQRALRTRGRSRDHRMPTYYAGFCLGEPIPLAAVIAAVIAYLDANPPTADAATAVYAALRARFPCRQPGG